MPSLEDALILAAEAHRGQVDKRGDPYLIHVMRVVLRMQTEEERIVAALHDVLEDCKSEPIRERVYYFPPHLHTAVVVLTRDAYIPELTYEEYIERVAKNPLARAVKMADLQDHLDNAAGVLGEEHRKRYRRALNYLLEYEQQQARAEQQARDETAEGVELAERERRTVRVFEMDGMEHRVPGREVCYCLGDKCPKCGGFRHYQPTYGGYYYQCEDCEKDDDA